MAIHYDVPGTVAPRYCGISMEITEPAREAGYRGRCPQCGRLFRDARDWAGAVCVTKEIRP